MSLDRDIAMLSRIPLFTELTTEQLRLLAFSAVRLELSPGQVLFRENAVAQSGYVVASAASSFPSATAPASACSPPARPAR
jgi:hypothetical protein